MLSFLLFVSVCEFNNLSYAKSTKSSDSVSSMKSSSHTLFGARLSAGIGNTSYKNKALEIITIDLVIIPKQLTFFIIPQDQSPSVNFDFGFQIDQTTITSKSEILKETKNSLFFGLLSSVYLQIGSSPAQVLCRVGAGYHLHKQYELKLNLGLQYNFSKNFALIGETFFGKGLVDLSDRIENVNYKELGKFSTTSLAAMLGIHFITS